MRARQSSADIQIGLPLVAAKVQHLEGSELFFRGLRADSLRKWLKQRKVKAVVPSTASRRTPYPLDSRAYKRRNLIERMFCKSLWSRPRSHHDRMNLNETPT